MVRLLKGCLSVIGVNKASPYTGPRTSTQSFYARLPGRIGYVESADDIDVYGGAGLVDTFRAAKAPLDGTRSSPCRSLTPVAVAGREWCLQPRVPAVASARTRLVEYPEQNCPEQRSPWLGSRAVDQLYGSYEPAPPITRMRLFFCIIQPSNNFDLLTQKPMNPASHP